MFLDQVTGKMSKPGEKMHKIVVETRDKVYYRKERDPDTGRWEDIEIGRGWEIVKEIAATEEGAQAWEAMSDEEQDALVLAIEQRML